MKLKKHLFKIFLALSVIGFTTFLIFYFVNFTNFKIETTQTKKEITKTEETKTQEKSEITVDHSKEIVFGQSRYKSKAFKLYGDIIESGIIACFNAINEQGGIKNKKLKLISMDDMGEPLQAEKNIDFMRTKYKIDMFLGNMGTRSIVKVLPLIENGEIAMFFPWAGGSKLTNPNLTDIINGPGLIKPQIELLIDHTINNLGFRRIAIFHADDGFSTGITNDAINLLKQYGISPLAVENYNRFTMNIKRSAKKLLKADPKVIICISTTPPTVKLISNFFEHGDFGTTFLGIDSAFLVGDILREKGAKFFYSSAVPDPKDASIPIVKEYQENLTKFFPEEVFNILSLTYYISAKIITLAIKNLTGPITKEKIIAQIEQMQDYDLGGFKVDFNPQNRHAFGEKVSLIKG